MKLRTKKLVIFISTFFLIIPVLFVPSSAESYIVDEDGKTQISMPCAYEISEVIQTFDSGKELLKEPADIFIDKQDNIYIADKGNNRIVMFNSQREFVRCYNGDGFQGPQGVYVDEYGDLFVADTLNSRIVHLSKEDKVVECFTKPETTLIDSNDSFSVSKLFIDSQGYIYVMDSKQFMLLDSKNNFMGFIGSNRLGFSLKRLMIRLFATKEQKQKMTDEEPVSYNNFVLGDDGMIYAVTAASGASAIRKITPSDKDAFTKTFNVEKIKTVEDNIASYKEPLFTDIAVDRYGIITVLEQNSKKLYQYTQKGDMIASFGGEGDKKGLFVRPSAIAVDSKGQVYVVDQSTGYLHIFEPTKFVKTVNEAVYRFSEGRYDDAMQTWENVLQMDANYPLANNGMGDCLLRTENYMEAMQYYKLTNNLSRYGEAFGEYRHSLFRQYFLAVVLIVLAIAVGAVLLIRFLKKRTLAIENGYYHGGKVLNGTHYALMVVFRPIEFCNIIKRERSKHFKWVSVIILFLLAFMVNYSYAYITNFQVSGKNINDTNLSLELAITVLPILCWTVSSYAMTSILGGESKFKELFLANIFCYVPFIVFSVLLSGVSTVMSSSELAIYNALRYAVIIYVLLLLFLCLKTLNDYTLLQAIGVTLLSLIAMVILIAVVLMVVSLSVQFYDFCVTVCKEIGQKYFL